MAVTIRQASAGDAAAWIDLTRSVLGDDFSDARVYDAEWAAFALESANGDETWLAEEDGVLRAAATFLQADPANRNPVAHLGRLLFTPEALAGSAAQELLLAINSLVEQRGQIVVTRVLAADNPTQVAFETLGWICTGYQPFKHMHRVRHGTLFYVWFARPDLFARLPLSESLPAVSELAISTLERLRITPPATVRDGATGYPLQTEVSLSETSYDDYELWRTQVASSNPPPEISRGTNLGLGMMRTPAQQPARALLATRDGTVIAGVAYLIDEFDRCIRFLDSFCADDVSLGALLSHATKTAQEQHGAVYSELDAIVTAPRLIKTAEQLGYVPVAYLPAFFCHPGGQADVVKLCKLNLTYSLDTHELTTQARATVEIVDKNFQDQKIGVAIINLLRGLPIFGGLGDGELRKMARLFTQKLYRPGEKVFSKGDQGNEAFVIMRGQIDIVIEEGSKAIATITNGQIFGELAFLDGAARNAHAIPAQASILLVIQRSSFNDLMQREPHLGMVVMRNIAMELSNRLRKANAALIASGKR